MEVPPQVNQRTNQTSESSFSLYGRNVDFNCNKKCFTLFLANFQGIRDKVSDIEVILEERKIDCLCVNEHWLSADEFSQTRMPGFSGVTAFCRSVKKRGGVSIYLRDALKYRILDITKYSCELHCEVAGIYIEPINTQVITVYRSPDGDLNKYFEIMTSVFDKIDISSNLIVAGDFNVHFETPNSKQQMTNFFFNAYNLHPSVNFNTRENACLDNVYINFLKHNLEINPYSLETISDHSGIIVVTPFDLKQNHATRVTFRPITEQNLSSLFNELISINWGQITNSNESVEKNFQCFINKITTKIDKCLPTKTKLVKGHTQGIRVNWFNDGLREMRERLKTLSIINRANPRLVSRETVGSYKKRYKVEINKAKRSAHDSVINNSYNKSQTMWNIIKSNSNITLSSQACVDSNLNSQIFNDYFVNIAENIVQTLPATQKLFSDYLIKDFSSLSKFKFKNITIRMVKEKISELKNKHSKDCYEINSRIIKYLKNVICRPLTDLFNQCINNNCFPNVLKTAKVIPIYKNKGNPESAENYRPISLLPIFSKILESLVGDQVRAYFETNNLFTQNQFGFRNKKSTTLAINKLLDYVTEAFEEKLDTHASFKDLTKAFDCISHDILFDKLVYYNFDESSIAFVRSFMTDREQFVFF